MDVSRKGKGHMNKIWISATIAAILLALSGYAPAQDNLNNTSGNEPVRIIPIPKKPFEKVVYQPITAATQEPKKPADTLLSDLKIYPSF